MIEQAPRLTPVAALLDPRTPDELAPFPGVAAALAARLRTDPASPMVTFYDDATGERIELSGATLDNWVAKTANLLVDTLGLAPGDLVAVDLPAHWLTVVVLFAAWSAGLEVAIAAVAEPAPDRPDGPDEPDRPERSADGPIGELPDVQVVFVAENRVDAALELDADEIVALSLRPLGARLAFPIAGVLDFAAEVPAHGDRFAAPPPPPSQAVLLAHAYRVASSIGLGPRDRLLSTVGPDTADGLFATLLAPLVAGASLVLCRNLDPASLARRIETERVTVVCGTPGAPPLGMGRLTVPSSS
jgi:acyl-CoA synthetase (AMP-forming)/AMP-acid ligase II